MPSEKAARDFRIQFKPSDQLMYYPLARNMLTHIYQKMSNSGVPQRCVGVCALHKTRGAFSLAVHTWPVTRFNQILDRHKDAAGWRRGLIITPHPDRAEFFTMGEVLAEMKSLSERLVKDEWQQLNVSDGISAAYNHFENIRGIEDVSFRRGDLTPTANISGLHASLLDARAARPQTLQPHRPRS